ncbi:MAG: sigma-70 family RNA polymerase sigma factor [Microbacteriaceae bacterium]|nr:sigma-70 family RNA polymerase sigma factor [Microbacteriaceae bacterium]
MDVIDETGVRARFTALVGEVADPLRRFLARRTDADTAEDVLADTLLVLWRRIREVPAAPGEALPWAFGVAHRTLANAERSARRRDRLAARIAAIDPPQDVPSPADSDADDGAAVRAALAGLRPADAEVLRLWAWEGLEAAAIGRVLSISPNAASIRLHRAKARLREELGKTAVAGGHVDGEGRRR